MSSESTLRDGFELIETLRHEPGLGLVRAQRHLARLAASAHELGFRYDPAAVHDAIARAVDPARLLRVRLALASDGYVGCTVHPFVPIAAAAVWTLAIAAARLDRDDPLVRHKTTRREVYQAARAEFPPDAVDEVILTNRQGQLCEGTITNIFLDMGDGGPLLTPSLDCGLLPGVLRAELIDSGRAVERELTPGDLAAANALHVGNSLRGLIRAALRKE
jgi:4-amino-4-deoxychorismate lyase